jgi:hypothetical protein
MRQTRQRRPGTFFRGGELPRLAAMVVMLGVLLLLMNRARDPAMWRWLAPDDHAVAQADKGIPARAPPVKEPAGIVPGPTDLDPLERDALREELAAVTDRAPLAKVEMPAYWRLMSWTLAQPPAEMRKRADAGVTFRDLWQDPQHWRGKLIEIPLHLRRTATVGNVAQNELGLTVIYEVWGWNSQSQPLWYWIVVPQLPQGMPGGESIFEEATFVGYFLKLLSYEDRQGKTQSTPLLIGRLVWRPAADRGLARRDSTWILYVTAALAVLLALRVGFALFGRARRKSPQPVSGDDEAVEAWLEGRAESLDDDSTPRE